MTDRGRRNDILGAFLHCRNENVPVFPSWNGVTLGCFRSAVTNPTTLFDVKILSDAKLEGFVAQIMVVRM